MKVVMPGDRIKLINMPNDPQPIEAGSLGTVLSITPLDNTSFQIEVDWDNGRTLSLVTPPDRFDLA